MAWYNKEGLKSPSLISSRIRIARNIKGVPFPHKASKDNLKEVYDICRKVYDENSYLKENFVWFDIENTPYIELQKLVEKHLISPDLTKHTAFRGAMVSSDEDICIMINEEDHIRIQVIGGGQSLKELMKIANKVDDIFASAVEYGYSDRLGYLTACPTNVGSGIRASIMVHLPLLTDSGYVNQLSSAAGRMGIAVRGMYGEGSKAEGGIYQVSNQITLGVSEEEIIKRINDFVQGLVKKEEDVRNKVYQAEPIDIEDKVWRAYGILNTARSLSSNELLGLMSNIRIGAELGIINVDSAKLNKLLVTTAPAHIAAMCDGEPTSVSRDVKRAEYIRSEVKNYDVQ
ncbi:MAG: protein arginine kinase [Eubacteriales bacterium]|nr:protein arginine kinase [Eubacteriales bacterium]